MGKVVLYVAAALWLCAVVLWPEDSDPTGEKERPEVAGEQLYKSSLTQAPFGLLGVNFYESNEGKKRWNIKSKFAELHRKENYAYLKDVTADFFAEKTGNMVQTKSRYGRSLIDKSLVELEGDVTIHSRRGYLFEMDTLHYDGKSHEFTTEDQVHMKGPSVVHPTMFLRGTGLDGNIDSEHFVIKRNCNAQRQLKNSEWLRINSRSGEFFTEEQRAIFTGKVHSMLPKVTIDSDLFELSVVEEKESLFAKGNVKLHQKDKLGSAEMAFMEIGSSRIVLEGNARIDSKDNQIRGRKIVLYSDDDRVEVESAEGRVAQ
jgi:LPS export ABC transporter protein LptC/lipopolysaccharide transport protein LptA